jgi:16S rRNA (cytidine1402-2'-O)-methyltransferase
MEKGLLYLIPSTLGSDETIYIIPQGVKNIISALEYFIVENEKSARLFLKNLEVGIIQQHLKITVLDKHASENNTTDFLAPAINGKNIGLLSEAGAPAVADPGSDIVSLAHKKNIKVVPLTGPSSILLALMASGFNGQRFCFYGYLPIDKENKKAALKKLEKESFKSNQTQIFIETPYRNIQMFQDIIAVCEEQTYLCIASDITLTTEEIKTKSIKEWKKQPPAINKRPTVFLLLKK